MGNFSWCTSDTRKSIAFIYASYEGAPKTVYLLNPFGEPYKESAYEGYGCFSGHDVYDLVVDWNRKYLSADNLKKPERDRWAPGEEGDAAFSKAMEHYLKKCRGIEELAAGASDEYMQEHYGTVFGYVRDGSDWKRCLGISIACNDEDHVKLKYPIKLVEHPVPYDEAGISPSCPFQGCFYEGPLNGLQPKIDRAFDRLDKVKDAYFEQLKDLSFVIKKCEEVSQSENRDKLEKANGIDREER